MITLDHAAVVATLHSPYNHTAAMTPTRSMSACACTIDSNSFKLKMGAYGKSTVSSVENIQANGAHYVAVRCNTWPLELLELNFRCTEWENQQDQGTCTQKIGDESVAHEYSTVP